MIFMDSESPKGLRGVLGVLFWGPGGSGGVPGRVGGSQGGSQGGV